MAEDKLLYSTRVQKIKDLKERLGLKGKMSRVQTSSPLKADEPGTNPEQLIGLLGNF